MKTPSITRLMPRRRLHRAFVKWFLDNRHRFPIELAFQRRTDRSIRFSFAGINPAIDAVVHTYGLSVGVKWEDECWDLIGDWDATPKRFARGYACKMCLDYFQSSHPDEEFTDYFATREEVWAKDVFEPFLEWVNDELAPARWIKLSRYGGATWAKLIRERSDDNGWNDYRNRQLVNALIPLGRPREEEPDEDEDNLTLYLLTRMNPMNGENS